MIRNQIPKGVNDMGIKIIKKTIRKGSLETSEFSLNIRIWCKMMVQFRTKLKATYLSIFSKIIINLRRT